MSRPPLASWIVAAVLATMAGSRIGSTRTPVPSMIRLVRAATQLSVVSASRNGNGRLAPRNRWSHAQTDAKPSSSAVAEYAVMASMSGTFRSGVKFSTAKPN